MGLDDSEKALSEDCWQSAEEIAEKTETNAGNTRIHLTKLVNKWKTAEVKRVLINHNHRLLYRKIKHKHLKSIHS